MYKIYTKDNCSFCRDAKKFLADRDEPFIEIDITDSAKNARFKKKYPDFKTVPQIFNEGDHIGGFLELVDYYDG